MSKKKTQAAQPEDIDIARVIACYFNELPDDTHLKILTTPNSIAFYLHQHPWAHHLFSILTWKHGDSAFGIFTTVLVALKIAEEKPTK